MLLALLLTLNPGQVRLVEDDVPKAERHAHLLEERSALYAARPKIVAPLLLISGGVASGLGGAACLWVGLFSGAYYAFTFAIGSVVFFTVGVVFAAAAVPLIVVGAVKLHRARLERRRIDQDLEKLEHEEAGLLTVAEF